MRQRAKTGHIFDRIGGGDKNLAFAQNQGAYQGTPMQAPQRQEDPLVSKAKGMALSKGASMAKPYAQAGLAKLGGIFGGAGAGGGASALASTGGAAGVAGGSMGSVAGLAASQSAAGIGGAGAAATGAGMAMGPMGWAALGLGALFGGKKLGIF